MKTIGLFLVVLMVLTHVPTYAQDEAPCKPDLSAVETLWENAKSAIADGENVLDILREIRWELALMDSQCSGLNQDLPAGAQVVGPVIVPEGIYKVTITTEDADVEISISADVIEGECGGGTGSYLDKNFASLFYAGTTGTFLFTSHECTTFWSVSSAGAPFTMTWEKVK